MPRKQHDPRTKEEVLNRMLSFDFHGIPELGEDVKIERTSPQTVELTFPKLGRTYELTVRIPREEGEEMEWTSEGRKPVAKKTKPRKQ